MLSGLPSNRRILSAREKSEEIARLTRRTLDSVTGGDSFPSLSVFLEDDHNSGMLAIRHHGEHPLYDVTARVVDLQKAASIKPRPGLTFEAVTAADTYLQIGTLVPSYISFRGRVDLGDVDRRDFNVFFVARNGGFTQNYRLVRVEKGWTSASRVIRDLDQKIMFEVVRDDYPRSKEGNVEW